MPTVTLSSLQSMRKELVKSRYYLNIRSGYMSPVTLHCSYGDSGETIVFYVFDGGDELDLNGAAVTLHGTRKDGANFGPFNCTTEGNSITFELPATMTAVEGGGVAEFTISKSGTTIGTCNFGFIVEDAVFPNGVSYDSDPSVYQDILTYVQAIPASLRTEYVEKFITEQNERITADSNLSNSIATEISNRTTACNNLSTRIDNIVATAGSSSTEVVDARTPSTKDPSESYGSLGAAIRGQIDNLYEYVEKENRMTNMEFPAMKNGTINNAGNTYSVRMAYTEDFGGCDAVTVRVNKPEVAGYHYVFDLWYYSESGVETGGSEASSIRWGGKDWYAQNNRNEITFKNINESYGKAFAVSFTLVSNTSAGTTYALREENFSRGDVVIIRHFNDSYSDEYVTNTIQSRKAKTVYDTGFADFESTVINGSISNWEGTEGAYAGTLYTDVPNRIVSLGFIEATGIDTIRVTNPNYATYSLCLVFYNKREVSKEFYIGTSRWLGNQYSTVTVPDVGTRVFFVVGLTRKDGANISTSDGHSQLSNYCSYRPTWKNYIPLTPWISTYNILRASINGNTGKVLNSTTRSLTKNGVNVTGIRNVVIDNIPDGYEVIARFYAYDNLNPSYALGGFGWYKEHTVVTVPDVACPTYLFLLFRKSTDAEITQEETVTALSSMKIVGYHDEITNIVDKATEFSDLVTESKATERFIFFTDPHTLPPNYNHYANESLIDLVKQYFYSTQSSFVLCGGDWLQSGDTKSEAKQKLAYVDGFMRKAFQDNYYVVNGNHDTNYQGIDTTGSEANTGELPIAVVDNLMFKRWNKAYYSFDGSNTRFYVLDSQLDWELEMDEYKWEQIDWFAKALKTDNKVHSAFIIHMWWNSAELGSPVPIAENAGQIITAYNARSSVTLNGTTYDFSTATGHVEFVLCGHMHVDLNYAYNNIPVIATINAGYGNNTFDLVHADYDERKLYLIRVGRGSNRTFNLDTGALIS